MSAEQKTEAQPVAPVVIETAAGAEAITDKPAVAAAEAPVEPKTEEPKPAVSDDKVEKPAEDAKAADSAAEEKSAPQTTLAKLASQLPEIKKNTGHDEMWGVKLSDDPETHVPTKIILQKYLRANGDDVAGAVKQLSAALEWRKKYNPVELVESSFDEAKFKGLGYVTTHKDGDKETVITWNIYGSVKDNKKTFGDVDAFIKWRSALMERGVQKLNLNSATVPLTDGEEDPYKVIQVHDYVSVSFFRMDPSAKAASKETINVLSTAYPELLAHKYFVNVPVIMGWMYAAMKLFVAPATLKKFHPMASGTSLAAELPEGIRASLPKAYGGQAGTVQEIGEELKLQSFVEDKTKEAVEPKSEEAPVAAVKKEEVAEEAKAEETPKVDEPKVENAAAEEQVKPAAEMKTA